MKLRFILQKTDKFSDYNFDALFEIFEDMQTSLVYNQGIRA